MRKDGSVFDARMYVSPLIDPKGQQTGWMTSMTNITEAKRIRDQLSASHERFTTVLEGLDAAVSVLSVQQGELLFANRSFRLWFGADSQGHALLAGAEEGMPVPRRSRRLGRQLRRPADAGAHRSRLRFARGLHRVAAEVVRRARALPAVDRRAPGADADRDRHHRAPHRRDTGREPGRQGAGHEPAGHDGRDGLVGRARTEPAADRDHQLLQRHGHAREEQRDRKGRPDRRAAEDLAPGPACRADHPPHPRLRETQRTAAPAGLRAQHRRRRGRSGRHRAAPAQRVDPDLRGAAPARRAGRSDPDRAGGAEPAEELGRGHRQRAPAAGAPQHRAARGAAAQRRRRRRDRVQRDRHGPGLEGRSDRPFVRSLLLDQGRRPGHRPESCAAPSSRATGAGSRPRTSTMATPQSGCRFSFTLPVQGSLAERPITTNPVVTS